MSSLAAQLAGIQANTNATILDKSKRKKIHSVSLVYEPKEAATQDFESIYYACMDSFRDLESIDKRFVPFMKTLFSETSVRFDRLVQQAEQVAALDQTIARFLKLISRYLNLEPAIASLEWLVRRFQIHLHNSEDLLLAFLPWYDSDVFVRVLDIIPMNGFPQLFEFLANSKRQLKAPSKSSLIRVMTKDKTLFTLVNQYVLQCVKQEFSFPRLLIFWSSLQVWILMHNKQVNNLEIIDDILLMVGDMIPLTEFPDCQTAAYIVLVVLASQFSLNDDVLNSAVSTICATWSSKSQSHGLATVAQLVQSAEEEPVVPLSKADYNSIIAIRDLSAEVLSIQNSHHIDRFLVKLCLSVLEYRGDLSMVLEILSESSKLGTNAVTTVLQATLKLADTAGRSGTKLSANEKEQIVALLEWASKQKAECVQSALSLVKMDREMAELALESSVAWPAAETIDISMADADNAEVDASSAAGPASAVTLAEIEKESDAMRMKEPSSYLVAESPERSARAQIWVHAIPLDITAEKRLKLVKVSKDMQVSFLASISLLPIPTQGRLQAMKILEELMREDDQDYQGLLPIVLVLLANSSDAIRSSAAKLLDTFDNRKRSSTWAKDTLYGPRSQNLVWLTRSELKPIKKQLHARLAECEADETFAKETASGAGKQTWMQFLCAHAASCELPQVLSFVLETIAGHKGVAKTLLPVLATYPNCRALWAARCASFKVDFAKLEQNLVAALYSNDEDCINFLCRLLSISKQVRNSQLCNCAGVHIVELWNKQFFTVTSQGLILESLLEIVLDEDAEFDAMGVLTNLELTTENFVEILRQCESQRAIIFTSANGRPALASADHAPSPVSSAGSTTSAGSGANGAGEEGGAIKRRRRRSSSSVQLKDSSQFVITLAERHLRRFTVILEMLNQSCPKLKEPGRLFPQLFGILDELVSLGTDSNLPVLYTEEILADCLVQIVEHERQRLSGASLPNSGSIRLDIIVSCIRTSTSPQVQNKLLLLVSSLATLVPDLVFHSVMPIFTFMGANTVRLDNDYSAHVIQQTIMKVLPALVQCGDKQEEIEIALRSFVAAFPHIPRHRRNKLFNAIIKTLQPRESLHKLLLLLARKFAEALSRQKYADAKIIRHFTTLFVRSFSVNEQLHALVEYVNFVRETSPSSSDKLTLLSTMSERVAYPALLEHLYDFAARTLGHNEVISQTQPLRMQILALSEINDETLALCAKLIEMLLRSEKQLASGAEFANARTASLRLLSSCLEILPIEQFVTVSISLLVPGGKKDELLDCDNDVKARVLALVSSRFEKEPVTSKAAITGAITLVESFKDALLENQWKLKQQLFDCLDILVSRFALSLSPELQLGVLDGLVGQNGLQSSNNEEVVSAINCINSISQNLGARVIGHFGRIMPTIFSRVEQSIQSGQNIEIQLASFALLSGFVSRIPSFMGSPTKQILELALKSQCDLEIRERLLELLGEKIDAGTVLTAFVSNWDSALSSGAETVSLYFDALDTVIATSAKKEVMTKASQLVGLVLRAFEVRGSHRYNMNEVNQIEARTISTTVEMVLKLNDKVFRPQFVRMTNWAFDSEGSTGMGPRTVVFFKFFVKLLGRLKSIVTSYFGYVLPYATTILNADTDSVDDSSFGNAKKSVLQAFVLSFASDQDDFWQADARFEAALDLFLGQLDKKIVASQESLLVKAIVGLAEATNSQDHKKRINDGLVARLLSHASPQTKLLAIRALSAIYQRLGDDWVSTLPQLVPLIAELLEDDDEDVENEVRRKLVPVIEEVLGESLDRYLS